MHRITWFLVVMLPLAWLGAAPAWAGGRGPGPADLGQPAVVQPLVLVQQPVVVQPQGQLVRNEPPGWNGHGQKKGWAKNGPGCLPPGVAKNQAAGKYPKGLEKPR